MNDLSYSVSVIFITATRFGGVITIIMRYGIAGIGLHDLAWICFLADRTALFSHFPGFGHRQKFKVRLGCFVLRKDVIKVFFPASIALNKWKQISNGYNMNK